MTLATEVPTSPSRSWSRWRAPLLKLVVTGSILAWLFQRVEIERVGALIRDSHPGWLVLAATATSLLLLTSTWKWDRLLAAVEIRPGYAHLLRLYTVGFFFSSFLPGAVGGDVVRWYVASDPPSRRARVAATILAERIVGVVALILLSLAVLVLETRLATAPTQLLVVGLAGAVALALWMAWNPWLARGLDDLSRGRVRRLVRPLRKVHTALTTLPGKTLAWSVLYSFAFYASAGLCFYWIGHALGAEIGLGQAFAVQALSCLVALVPLSIGGLGLIQAGDVYLLGLLGVDAETALAMSFLRQGINYLYALLGALLFLGSTTQPSFEDLRAFARRAEPASAP